MILLIFPGIIGILVCLVILIIQAFTKKKNTKTLIALVFFFIMCAVALSSLDSDTETAESKPTAATFAEASEAPTEQATEETTEQTTAPTEKPILIELIAGEPGEYGHLFSINKGTEFEETYYIYQIPSGTYTVTNTGEYMNQFNVYSDEMAVTEDGWEEPAEVPYVTLLDVGESDTFTIVDGYHIEIQEPGRFSLEMVG